MAACELTELETAIEKIVSIFFTYAAREGKKGTLTAGEFKELVTLQLPNLMKVPAGGGGRVKGSLMLHRLSREVNK
uniref:S100/CaBP-9k-type calcium binding subdomain domain-containing protein n=1 Tax=Chelydra serpentina TaxID=8475 RepID=A0A8C3S5Z6_CHESE